MGFHDPLGDKQTQAQATAVLLQRKLGKLLEEFWLILLCNAGSIVACCKSNTAA
jgi:hypothetical protein